MQDCDTLIRRESVCVCMRICCQMIILCACEMLKWPNGSVDYISCWFRHCVHFAFIVLYKLFYR